MSTAYVKAAFSALFFGAGALFAGCATVIVPPVAPSDPVNVFVVDHGHTSSLVIPSPDGSLLRYAYGDWAWYALGQHNLGRGVAALLWPSQSGLGRAQLKGPSTVESVRWQVPSPVSIHPVPIDRARLLSFEHNMQALYHSRPDTEVSNPANGMTFVHHPRPYSYFWNSNHAVASWLRELGCATRGLSFEASWRVAASQPPNSYRNSSP
jgi:hypothetical protein